MPSATPVNGKISETSSKNSHAKGEINLNLSQDASSNHSMSIISRFLLFFGFPTFMGSLGLSMAYISNRKEAAVGESPKSLDFDRDFIFPFLMSLVIVIVIGIQTGGFSYEKAFPILTWPKVVKKKKIVRKTVVVDDDGKEVEFVEKEDKEALEEWNQRINSCKTD